MGYITMKDFAISGGLCSQLQIYASLLAVAKANNLKIIEFISMLLYVIIGFLSSILILNNFYFVSLSSQSKIPFINVFPFATGIHHFIIVMGPLLFLLFIYIKNSININNPKLKNKF